MWCPVDDSGDDSSDDDKDHKYCLTKADCQDAVPMMNLHDKGWPKAKGCFKHGGKAFWKEGTKDEMTSDDFPNEYFDRSECRGLPHMMCVHLLCVRCR